MGSRAAGLAKIVARIGSGGIAAFAVLLLACHAMAQEDTENRGTPEQRMACMGDAFRLCSSEIPNVDRIVSCMKREKRQLSVQCREVFEPTSARLAAGRSFRRRHRGEQSMQRERKD
jgi:hypothetical protein